MFSLISFDIKLKFFEMWTSFNDYKRHWISGSLTVGHKPFKSPLCCIVSQYLTHLSFRKLNGLSQQGNHTTVSLPVEMLTCSLQDLISYFQPTPESLDHEAKQNNMTMLKNRQSMFQKEVINE